MNCLFQRYTYCSLQVELKRRGIDIREAVNQVMRYKKHSYNGLYHFIQLFIVSQYTKIMVQYCHKQSM